ncbi:hypothetical protein CDAR_393651 [Caerostris darwini]|uniref:Secreted protein n=1 Tax=Caerostris darwini TaxID=1538125 RepID=A0AAV4W8S1_9ARAC|nr:hypothetical protein CDAR_393651 [Caerostris darwini]
MVFFLMINIPPLQAQKKQMRFHGCCGAFPDTGGKRPDFLPMSSHVFPLTQRRFLSESVVPPETGTRCSVRWHENKHSARGMDSVLRKQHSHWEMTLSRGEAFPERFL